MDHAATLYRAIIGRDIDADAAQGLAGRDPLLVALELLSSAEATDRLLDRAIDVHPVLIHRARQVMLRTLLPAARRILDLGGANAPLYRSGYPYPFDRLVMVDLPPDARHAMYHETQLTAPEGCGEVVIHYGDMTDLSAFDGGAFDLVWSGESIEHVEREAAIRMIGEAFRVLEPGGRFCLDTPNRGLTEVHTRDWHGGFIHPDHRHEFRADELRTLLESAGFVVEDARGICAMPETRRSGAFCYSDFVLGNPVADNIEDGYLLFFRCRKPWIRQAS